MSRIQTFVWLIVLSSLLVLLTAASAQDGTEPAIELRFSNAEADINEIVDLEVWLNDGVDIYGGQFSLLFDPAQLEVVPTTEGEILAHGPYFGDPERRYVLADGLTAEAGRIDYAVVVLGDAPSITGSDQLFKMRFRVLTAVPIEIQVVDSKLGTRELEEIFPQTEDAMLNAGVTSGVDNLPLWIAFSTASALAGLAIVLLLWWWWRQSRQVAMVR